MTSNEHEATRVHHEKKKYPNRAREVMRFGRVAIRVSFLVFESLWSHTSV